MPDTPENLNNKFPSGYTGLIIAKNGKQALSKSQEEFNQLVLKIEKLRQQLQTEQDLLEEKLQYYAKQIFPLEQQQNKLRKEMLMVLLPFFTDKKALPKGDKKVLQTLLSRMLQSILSVSHDVVDEEVKAAFETVEGMTLEEARAQEAKRLREQMAQMFEQAGYAMELNDLDLHMDAEALEQKLHAMEEEFNAQQNSTQNAKKAKKKSGKKAEKEAQLKQEETLKTKSISSIYKQLAKLLHPDLEQDEAEKLRKEGLMQEVIAAYKNNDLHTLLKLELQWIALENDNLNTLTDDKLRIYNNLLKEQISGLETDIYRLPQQPRFQGLLRFAQGPGSLKYLNLNKEKKTVQEQTHSLQETFNRLRGTDALTEVKALVYMFSR